MATITVTPTQTFISGDTVTPATLNQLAQSTVALTAGTIVAADIASDAVITAKILDANVTTAKLATVTQQSLLPAGAVMPFARATAPARARPNGTTTGSKCSIMIAISRNDEPHVSASIAASAQSKAPKRVEGPENVGMNCLTLLSYAQRHG